MPINTTKPIASSTLVERTTTALVGSAYWFKFVEAHNSPVKRRNAKFAKLRPHDQKKYLADLFAFANEFVKSTIVDRVAFDQDL